MTAPAATASDRNSHSLSPVRVNIIPTKTLRDVRAERADGVFSERDNFDEIMRRHKGENISCTTKRLLRIKPLQPIQAHREMQAKALAGLAKRQPAKVGAGGTALDPAAALSRFVVTDEVVQAMSQTITIWRDMMASAHIGAWAAPGNGGKTTVAKHAAGELAAQGWQVFYFQEDAGAGDLPDHFAHAKEHGYTLLNSTLANSTPTEQIEVLHQLVESGADLSKVVMFFDTLKKFAELMSKGATREFFLLLRALTTRGATVVLLAHTNKHRGIDGKLIFEGVGDVRNDVDELIYLESTERDPSGKITITMTPDKVRAAIRPLTFELDTTTMSLRPLDRPVDIHRVRQQQEDAEIIAAVMQAIKPAGMSKTKLADLIAAKRSIGRRAATAVIDRYAGSEPGAGVLWLQTHMRANNTIHISLPPTDGSSDA